MTKNKLWQHDDTGLHPLIEAYTTGTDQQLDQQLLGYDIDATKAHVGMLKAIGIISDDEERQLQSALDLLRNKWETGQFVVTTDYEDGHTAIESFLIEQTGVIGKKVHTGRSRNDQALVMMRLYLKDQLLAAKSSIQAVVDAYETKSHEAGDQAMPGYTHSQKAMPSTVAMWLESYHDAFEDVIPYTDAALSIIDQNPLGSAAGYGVNLPLDRSITTKALKFKKTQENPMYCGLSRGMFELMSIQALSPAMLYAGKFAEDMLMFTMQETGFFSLPDSMTTGSSIMPHKRNYDVFEIMRANAHRFNSYISSLSSVVGAVGSGYYRDLQLTKATTLEAFTVAQETLDVLALTVSSLRINKQALDNAMTDDLQSVAQINELVSRGVPFRDAYKQVKRTIS